MSKARKFRKIILKSEVVILEEEESLEQHEVYSSEFNVDFSAELAFIKYLQEKTEQNIKTEEEEEIQNEVSNEFLKNLHRELARVLHPDLNQNSDDEDFKKMQAAYEIGDASVLICLAAEYNIDLDFDDQDLEIIEQQIVSKNKKIDDRKKTCSWVWGASNKSDNLKIQIRTSLDIDEEEFKEWLTTNKE
tara:strand:- start:3 stop:572 length:570 start_codon:yes stop_codon:yes gene_type:complete